MSSFNYADLDKSTSNQWTNQDKFKAQFYLERVIEVLDSTPVYKNFLKDAILNFNNGQVVEDMCVFLNKVSLSQPENENEVYKYKLANSYVLRLINSQGKNHPHTQKVLSSHNLLPKFYCLSQAKFKEKVISLIA